MNGLPQNVLLNFRLDFRKVNLPFTQPSIRNFRKFLSNGKHPPRLDMAAFSRGCKAIKKTQEWIQYPGYQRFFSCAVGIFGVGWRPKPREKPLARSRLRVVPHFSSGIVERAKRERTWKSPHARKGNTRRGERKMRDYRQSPSFWTNALLSQRKTLIGSSMEICQHLSKTRQPLSTLDIITICRTEQITRVALACSSN